MDQDQQVQAVPKIARPFDDFEEEEEKKEWAMAEYAELQVVGNDGITFAGKTAFMIAHERQIESEKAEDVRLICDPLAKYFAEPYGKKVSEMFAHGLKQLFDPTGDQGLGFEGHVVYTACRTRLINDQLAKWIQATEGTK